MNVLINPYAFAVAASPPEDIIYEFTDLLGCTRASTGYAQTAAGALTSFAANTLRITDKGLLIEESRINQALQSQDFASGWLTIEMTVTANTTVAPDGTTTADTLTDSTANSAHRLYRGDAAIASGSYTLSVYAKAGTHSWIQLWTYAGGYQAYANFNVSTGVVGATDATTSRIEALAGGWYRCSLTSTTTAFGGGVYVNINMLSGNTAAVNPDYVGTGTTVHVWGMQYENGAYPSSYIPTTSAAVTRAQDLVTLIGDADAIITGTAASAVVYLDAAPKVSGIDLLWGANTTIPLYKTNDTSVGFYDISAGALEKTGLTSAATAAAKYGSAWSASGGRSVTGQGLTVATVGTATTLPTTPVTLGSRGSGSPYFIDTYVRSLKLWDARLSDAELVTETT